MLDSTFVVQQAGYYVSQTLTVNSRDDGFVREKDLVPDSDAGVVENVAPRDSPATSGVSCGILGWRRVPIMTPTLNYDINVCPWMPRKCTSRVIKNMMLEGHLERTKSCELTRRF